MRLEELGLIGNCQIAALVQNTGSIVWACLPRFDSEPVFATLLDEHSGGEFTVAPVGETPGQQRYVENTNVLETTFQTVDGRFKVIDFAPRYVQYDRMFRPTQLFRIIEPIDGLPRVSVTCRPRLGWSKRVPHAVYGSNHVEFEGFSSRLRLTTDVPLSAVNGPPFALTERRHLALTWGAPLEGSLPEVSERFLSETLRYWARWVKHCTIPPAFQTEVIRSALALKLHCFEDTGAIIASITTSIPEASATERTWDYRYCWLRDAYYVLGAFRLLGHFEEREHFIQYLLNVVASAPELNLAPLYRVDGSSDLEERILPEWPGFEGHGPVRVGNAAARQIQHDVFGEMVLALTPIFLDDRYSAERTKTVLGLVEGLARRAISVAGSPDAGIWEYRNEPRAQTFSSVMCWAAADRMSRIATRHIPGLAREFEGAAATIREQILTSAWNGELNSFVGAHGGTSLDASLLQMAILKFLPADDPRLVGTISAIGKELGNSGWLYRYKAHDGLGMPTVAFVICTYWMIEALATIGRIDEARALFERTRSALSPLELLSEDYDVEKGRMWGNFPQAYSHVGLIHAAFAASPRWADVL